MLKGNPVTIMENDVSEPIASSRVPSTEELFVGPAHKKRLNQWLATGICGNDVAHAAAG